MQRDLATQQTADMDQVLSSWGEFAIFYAAIVMQENVWKIRPPRLGVGAHIGAPHDPASLSIIPVY